MNYEEIIPERMHRHHPKYVLEDIRVAGEILASWEKTKWGLNAALKHLAFLLLLIPLVHLLWTVVQTAGHLIPSSFCRPGTDILALLFLSNYT